MIKQLLQTTACAIMVAGQLFASDGAAGPMFPDEVQRGLDRLAGTAAGIEDPNTLYKVNLARLIEVLPEVHAISPDFANALAHAIEGTKSVRLEINYDALRADDFHDPRARKAECSEETMERISFWAHKHMANQFGGLCKPPEGLSEDESQRYLGRAASAYYRGWREAEGPVSFMAAHALLDKPVLNGEEGERGAAIDLLVRSGAVHSLSFEHGSYDPVKAIRGLAGDQTDLIVAVGLGRQMPGAFHFNPEYSGVRFACEAWCGITPFRSPHEIGGMRVIDICADPGHATAVLGTAGGITSHHPDMEAEEEVEAAAGDDRPRNPMDVFDGLGDASVATVLVEGFMDLHAQFHEGLLRIVKPGGVVRVFAQPSQTEGEGIARFASPLVAAGSGFILASITPTLSPDIEARMAEPLVSMNFVRTDGAAAVADPGPLLFDTVDPSLRAAWDAVLAVPTE